MSLRIKTLASFVNIMDKVADVGCDHAYLAIYLAENNSCQSILATEINPHSYQNASQNIKHANLEDKIKLFLTDGIKDIASNEVDTLIIAGLGTHTILQIIKDAQAKNIKKLIIQSNNDLYLLRSSLKKRGFYLTKEKVLKEKDIWYTIDVFTLTKYKQTNLINYWGIKEPLNKKYLQENYHHLQSLNNKVTFKDLKRKLNILYQIYLIKKYL